MTETQDKRTPENKGLSADNPQGKPLGKPLGKSRLPNLEERRAQNLRDNLMRRKQQARARSENDGSATS